MHPEQDWNHPRSCGKDGPEPWPIPGKEGSPPLVRERLHVIHLIPLSTGITPARAGKTFARAIARGVTEDHPRSCGKDFMIFRFFRCHRGSPPLVRERQLGTDRDDVVGGITPARAGKTKGSPGRQQCAEDHPRSCGKDIGIISIISMALGSPPLVRERHEKDRYNSRG